MTHQQISEKASEITEEILQRCPEKPVNYLGVNKSMNSYMLWFEFKSENGEMSIFVDLGTRYINNIKDADIVGFAINESLCRKFE